MVFNTDKTNLKFKADYEGAWDINSPEEIGKDNRSFLLKILEEKDKEFRGIIIDAIGESTFQGAITGETIDFTKKYSAEAIQQNNALETPITYHGIRRFAQHSKGFSELVAGFYSAKGIAPKTFIMRKLG